HEGGRHGADAAFALDRLDQDGGGFRADGVFKRCDVAERHLVEAVDLGAEAVDIFLLPASGDGRKRAAMKRAFEGDGAEALRIALGIVVAARSLDRAFQRLGARISEEHAVGEAVLDETRTKTLLAGDLVEVRNVPELGGLLGEGGDQLRVAVAKRIDGNTGGKVEVALADFRHQPTAFATVKCQRCAGKGLEKCGSAHYIPLRLPERGSYPFGK